jgi:hypothetical protein
MCAGRRGASAGTNALAMCFFLSGFDRFVVTDDLDY